jgi:hypothetical protein
MIKIGSDYPLKYCGGYSLKYVSGSMRSVAPTS